jgi:hypothetical protein
MSPSAAAKGLSRVLLAPYVSNGLSVAGCECAVLLECTACREWAPGSYERQTLFGPDGVSLHGTTATMSTISPTSDNYTVHGHGATNRHAAALADTRTDKEAHKTAPHELQVLLENVLMDSAEQCHFLSDAMLIRVLAIKHKTKEMQRSHMFAHLA